MESTEEDTIGTELVERTTVEAMERAQIDIQIATAHRFPKHSPQQMSRVKAAMLTLATMDEETAASCFYSLPRGGKTIQGESVRLAEIALTCYGNARVQARIVETVTSGDAPHVIVQAAAHDLEQNVAFSAEKRRRIVKKKFKDAIDEDDINLATNACTAIAFRDAVLKMIPKVFVRQVMMAAKKVAVGDVRSLAAKRADVVERLQKMGATLERILAVVGCTKVEDIGMEQLETLIGLGTGLKDGEISLEEAFPAVIEKLEPTAGRQKFGFFHPQQAVPGAGESDIMPPETPAPAAPDSSDPTQGTEQDGKPATATRKPRTKNNTDTQPQEPSKAQFDDIPQSPAALEVSPASASTSPEPPLSPFVCPKCGLGHNVKPAGGKCLGRDGTKCDGTVVVNSGTWECGVGHKFAANDIVSSGANPKGKCPTCDGQGKSRYDIRPVQE